MAHRSNQAVVSQEQAAPPRADPPPPPRRFLIGWATVLVALATSTMVLGGVLWLARFPIAEFFVGATLAQHGLEADFKVVNLDFENVTLRDVRVGAAGAPDLAISSLRAHWLWRGLSPALSSVELVQPRLRLDLDRQGRVSAGALDHVSSPPSGRRPVIPRVQLRIRNGVVRLHAPFGDLNADVEASGTIGRDFQASARLPPSSLALPGYGVRNGAAELIVSARSGGAWLRFSADAEAVQWGSAHAQALAVHATGQAPLDLSRYALETAVRIGAASAPNADLRNANAAAIIAGAARSDSLAPAQWRAEAHADAERTGIAPARAQHLRFDGQVRGNDLSGHGRWTIAAQQFAGFSMAAPRLLAEAALTVDLHGAGALASTGRIAVAGAALDRGGTQVIANALPSLNATPVGPSFAHARSALIAAGRRFDLNLGFNFTADPISARLVVAAPVEARAASGAKLQLKPLREDAPALSVQWPGAALHGAVEIDLAGGGVPNSQFLFDSIDWAPNAPFDAQGTATLENWGAAGAGIAAQDLNLGVTVNPESGGRLDLAGPVRISGPLGDGGVRDLVAKLDVSVTWNRGWRVAANQHCLPVTLSALNAAGLSFSGGGFNLCAIGDTLIAADPAHRLSGGFRIEGLALNGRMSAPAAEPARLSAARVQGLFHGATDHIELAVAAAQPAFSARLGKARALNLHVASLTANAQFGARWRLDGQFNRGALEDPAAPGIVSAIQGRWSATSENDKPAISVEAAQALLTAPTPASAAELPYYHPLRIADFNAVLRQGRIDAQGALVLAAGARPLARFSAEHDLAAGAGGARIVADRVMFGPQLQPYDLSELARGMVDNVRGRARAEATVAWSNDRLAAAGVVHLDGVSLSTGTIPIIEDVRGDIAFDDLLALTTAPGQHLHVGLINPGVAARNGDVFFQLLAGRRVAIEHARFDFASGALTLVPTTIALGADATRFELELNNVDAAALIATLNIPDVAATGHIQGRFPLLLTRRSALVQNGVLASQDGGGTISYVGHAGDGAAGMARVAFDALRSFRYDNLRLTLNGDLAGEIVSQIQFTGHNSGKPLDLGPIANIPGVGRVSVRGVPFDFHVNVTAPFRGLADTAASIVDPTHLLRGNQNRAAPVDQTPPPPR
jgi:hypothetical protein